MQIENILAIYYYTAVFSTILFLIKTIVFSFTGGDTEVTTDFNSEFEVETSFHFISIQSILAFFMGFGWLGLACLKQWGFSLKLTGLCSAGFGLLLMFFSAYLMFLVKKLNHRVVNDYSACIGKIGKAYTAFEPHAEGQIEVDVNGRLSIEKAVNNTDTRIESFEQIQIKDYKDKMFYIEK